MFKGKDGTFFKITEFLQHQVMACGSNTFLKLRERLTRPEHLILYDYGMRKFTSQEAEVLKDIIEQRSYGKSTMITTQLPTDHWGETIGDEIILDALVYRLDPSGLVNKL